MDKDVVRMMPPLTTSNDPGPNVGLKDDGGMTTGGGAREEMAQAQAQTPGGDGSLGAMDAQAVAGRFEGGAPDAAAGLAQDGPLAGNDDGEAGLANDGPVASA